MTVRSRTRGALASAVIGAAALAVPAISLAEAPADGQSTTKAFDSPANLGIVVNDNATVTSTIEVEQGQVGAFLSDVDVTTSIPHTHSGDLRIQLVSPGPNPKTIDLVTPRPEDHAINAFEGTLWDDSNPIPGATFTYDRTGGFVNVTAPQAKLAPRGGLGSLVGINPVGVWTLKVSDTAANDTGYLNQWSLSLTTRPAGPATSDLKNYTPAAADQSKPVTNAAPTEMSVNVQGATGKVWALNALTRLVHNNPSELKIELIHGDRAVVLSDGVSGPFDFYNQRQFDDSAAMALADNVAPGPVIPYAGLAAFRGMDPNGLWTLRVTDSTGALPTGTYDGTLSNWELNLQTADLSGATRVISVPTTPIVGRGATVTTGTNPTAPGAPKVVVAQPKPSLRTTSTLRWRGKKLTGKLTITGVSPSAQRVSVKARGVSGTLVSSYAKRLTKKHGRRKALVMARKRVIASRTVAVKAGKVSVRMPAVFTKRLKKGTYRVEIMSGKTLVSRSTVRVR
ncbi:MAG: proprotein convertase P-domain-containing protein [Thermoleophilia bacterium]|nr:proprotein convertase P-domain-containing protein [Thermoleophilia bacterium]